MRATRIMANLRVADVDAAKFYTGYLGLSTEEFSMGWVARYTSPDTGRTSARHADATSPELGHFHPRPTSKVPMKKRRNSATRS